MINNHTARFEHKLKAGSVNSVISNGGNQLMKLPYIKSELEPILCTDS